MMRCWRLLCLYYYSLERTHWSEIYVNRFSISAPVHTLQTERANNQPDFTLPRTRSIHCIHTRQTIGRFHGARDSQLAVAIAIMHSVRHTNKAADFTVPGTGSLVLCIGLELINYIGTKAKCRHLKIYTVPVKGLCDRFFVCLPSPPMTPYPPPPPKHTV